MAPYFREASIKLAYPLYGADFDPLNSDFLLVGGGGGSVSTGVPNKITLLDVSRRKELSEVTDIELSKNEDSVTTLAVASSSDNALTAIAGINSSTEDQAAGKNEHLRSFRVPLPVRKQQANGTPAESEKTTKPTPSQALGKTALFKSAYGKRNDTYQRILRASPVKSTSEARISIIASGLAPENEIIAFQPVSNALTSTVDEISRISLGKAEAEDVDVIPVKRVGHLLAYCTSDSVFIQILPNTKGSKIEKPVKLYEAPTKSGSSLGGKFRALRLLTPKHILLLQNLPNNRGAELIVLRIDQENTSGLVTLQKRLSSAIKKAVSLDVSALSENPSGEKQFVIAVASNSQSIEILTIEYTPAYGLKTFIPYTTLKSVHPGPLTRLTFSNFIGPSLPTSKDTLPQSIRLASVSVEGTVVVQTLPLAPYPDATKTDNPRYVLNNPGASGVKEIAFSSFMAIVVVSIVAFLLQCVLEIRGAIPPKLGAPDWLSPEWRNWAYKPYYILPNETGYDELHEVVKEHIEAIKEAPSHISVPDIPSMDEVEEKIEAIKEAPSHITVPEVPNMEQIEEHIEAIKEAPSHIPVPEVPSMEEAQEHFADYVSDRVSIPEIPSMGDVGQQLVDIVTENSGLESPRAIVLRDDGDGLTTELHHDAELIKEEALKKWDELSEKQKHGWKQRLVNAGHWAEHQGESVLKGILFSELAHLAAG